MFPSNFAELLPALNKFSTVITSPGPAFQECTGSYHENVPAPKAVSSDLPPALFVTDKIKSDESFGKKETQEFKDLPLAARIKHVLYQVRWMIKE